MCVMPHIACILDVYACVLGGWVDNSSKSHQITLKRLPPRDTQGKEQLIQLEGRWNKKFHRKKTIRVVTVIIHMEVRYKRKHTGSVMYSPLRTSDVTGGSVLGVHY